MLLGARLLENVADINHFEVTGNVTVRSGENNFLYIQLVDLNQNKENDPSGLRFIPQGSVNKVTVIFPSIDDNKEFSRIAVQPFTGDESIWRVEILDTDTPSSGNLIILLEEDGKRSRALIEFALSVEDLDELGAC